MVTIEQALDKFLEEQEARLRPRTYRGYDYAINLFVAYLDGYAYQYLDGKDAERYKKLRIDYDRRFIDVFGPEIIDTSMVSEFLGDFMVRKVMCGKDFMRTTSTVMRRLMKWMHERGYMGDEEREEAIGVVDALKDDLPKVVELAYLILEYADNAPWEDYSRTQEGYFTVTRVEPGRLWLKDNRGSGRKVGPISVSKEISSMCKVGWTISLELGKTKEGWRILQSGCVYPS
jgi:hypothetical protein